jgi:molybdenum-dependent DNA-binding transcriptional regulator ModE
VSEGTQLPHLETFSKAAELGSFTAAARGLGLTQAAVSQRIHALEQELGVALFTRQGGRVQLTDAGRRLHGFARRILDLHRQAREEVTGRSVPLKGELSLAASSVPDEHVLPALMSVFRARYPHIRVKATVADSRAVLAQVEHGEASVAAVLAGQPGGLPFRDLLKAVRERQGHDVHRGTLRAVLHAGGFVCVGGRWQVGPDEGRSRRLLREAVVRAAGGAAPPESGSASTRSRLAGLASSVARRCSELRLELRGGAGSRDG